MKLHIKNYNKLMKKTNQKNVRNVIRIIKLMISNLIIFSKWFVKNAFKFNIIVLSVIKILIKTKLLI